MLAKKKKRREKKRKTEEQSAYRTILQIMTNLVKLTNVLFVFTTQIKDFVDYKNKTVTSTIVIKAK